MNRVSENTFCSVFFLKHGHTLGFVFLILCVILGGCGRRGPLEPPPVQTVSPSGTSAPEKSRDSGLGDGAPLGFKKSSARVPLKAPNTPFFLDGLLGSKSESVSKGP